MPGGVMQLARQTRAPILPVVALAVRSRLALRHRAAHCASSRAARSKKTRPWCSPRSSARSWRIRSCGAGSSAAGAISRWRDMSAGRARPVVALTGATGFVGRHLVPLLASAGWRVRLLMRRDPVCAGMARHRTADRRRRPARRGRAGAAGQGVDAVVHVAGAHQGRAPRAFLRRQSRAARAALAEAMLRHAPPRASAARVDHCRARAAAVRLCRQQARRRGGRAASSSATAPRCCGRRPSTVRAIANRWCSSSLRTAVRVPLARSARCACRADPRGRPGAADDRACWQAARWAAC